MTVAQMLARSYQKQYQYNPTTDGTNVITLVSNPLSLITDKVPSPDPTTWVNGFIKVLQCKSAITSLTEVPMPDIQPDDTDSQQLTKVQQAIWNSPAYRLVVWVSDTQTGSWVEKIYYNLQNSYGFPYTMTSLLDGLTTDIARDIAEGGRLGVSFRDIGYGIPSTNDLITFDCVWSAEYNWLNAYDITISQPVVVQTATVQNVTQHSDTYTQNVGTTAKTVLAANTSRLNGYIKNASANTIYYALGSTVSSTNNTGTLAANAQVSFPAGYTGVVSAIANTGSLNSVVTQEVYNVAQS